MQSPDIFTERVSHLMKRNSLSKKDMASRLNVDYSTFWRKLKGKRNVDMSVLIQIARILGTSVSYLVGETDNPALPYVQDVPKRHSAKELHKMYGERARKRRKELGLSCEKVAEALGTTRVTVSRWELDTSEPDDRTKIALAKLLNTSVAYLIGETDNPNISETGKVDGSLANDMVLPEEPLKETLRSRTSDRLIFRYGECYIEVPDTPSNQEWFKEIVASVVTGGVIVG